MNLRTRIGIVAMLLAAVGGAIAYLSAGGKALEATAGTRRWLTSAQCRECHQALYDEWRASHHSIAYTNPEVRALSDDFRKEECKDCHLPRPLAVTGFGNRTLPRNTQFDEGVSCITCHLAPDGGLLARNDRPEVPCRPQRSAEFLAVEACASCHNQHQTTDQWRASHWQKQGTDCAACHMPQVERVRADGSKRFGRKHVFEGAHDLAMLKKAYELTVQKDGDQLDVALENSGAGHNFPTEERHRAVDIVVRFMTAAGPGEWQRAWRFRQPYRDEATPVNPGNATGENTQLPAGAQKQVRVPIPGDAVAAEVRLWYRLTPFVLDDDPRSTLLEERRVPLR